MFGQMQLFQLELKQAGWPALFAPTLSMLPFGIFLAMYLSVNEGLHEIAFSMLDGLLIILPVAGAALWSYLFTGNTFERSRHSFLAADTHYAFKAFLRAGVSLSFICTLAAGISMLCAPEYVREIVFLTLRTTAMMLACMAVISLCSYVLHGAYIGIVASTVFAVLSFSGLAPRGGETSLNYSYLMFFIAAAVAVTLLICEKYLKRG